MGKALLVVGTLLALLIGGLVAVAWIGRAPESLAVDNVLSESITRAVATADQTGAELALADVTDFPWDRVLLVAPGTPREQISRRLGRTWQGDLGYEAGDVLIFLQGGDVERFANYRGRGRFERVARPFAEFTPATAVFTVEDLVVRPRR